MIEFWEGLGRSARVGLALGFVAILALTAALAWWLLRSDYKVLFSELKPQDASAMITELEKLKIPYRVDEASASILVDKSQVHSARIKLMGKEFPLQGAVGFELFNNTDFGMTEFAQKINYQRALQGELTRTILSLAEVRDVRVHLALPEQGLFKQPGVRPKAAITLSLREGHALRPEQVSGIQRLVAAATPGMTAQDVTVVDRQGMALSRVLDEATDGFSGAAGTGRLELKKETETLLAQKASAVLDKAFGPGEALVSVDATLNMDQVRVTTEDVIPGASRSPEPRGVIVKERESSRESGALPLDAARSAAGAIGSSQREVDYQVGRRVEQVTSQAGAVRRIQVVAVVRQHLDSSQEEKLKRLLGAAVGIVAERGDTVVVQSLGALLPSSPASEATPQGVPIQEPGVSLRAGAEGISRTDMPSGEVGMATPIRMLLALGVIGLGFYWAYRVRRDRAGATSLSDAERQVALRKIAAWMQESSGRQGGPEDRPVNRAS